MIRSIDIAESIEIEIARGNEDERCPLSSAWCRIMLAGMHMHAQVR